MGELDLKSGQHIKIFIAKQRKLFFLASNLISPTSLARDAGSGSISGLTLFSGKKARIISGQDITDFAFYIQNINPADITLVSAARDIIAYNANTASPTLAKFW